MERSIFHFGGVDDLWHAVADLEVHDDGDQIRRDAEDTPIWLRGRNGSNLIRYLPAK